jgi:uncharacterized protein (DUF305 family)
MSGNRASIRTALGEPLKTLIICLTVLVSVGCAHRAERRQYPGVADYDAQFLKGMLDHHMNWDRMIDPCVEKPGLRQELHDLCSEMEKARTAEAGQMISMLKQWYNEDPPSPDLYPLWLGGLNGSEFESNFLKQMSEHHSEGIEMSAKCAADGTHVELKQLCARMQEEQKSEQKRLKQYSCEWFQKCQ